LVIFKKLPKINNQTLGEKSPNLVTLLKTQLQLHENLGCVATMPETF
jgi:hypothetical protein